MKRPTVIYFVIVLQVAIGIALAAVLVTIVEDRVLMRENVRALFDEQVAMHDTITALAGVLERATEVEERTPPPTLEKRVCGPSSEQRTDIIEYKDDNGDGSCKIDRWERTLRDYVCTLPPLTEERIEGERHIGTFRGAC